MAVVTYTVTVAGGGATISPDPSQIVLVDGDYVIFKRLAGTVENIDIRVVGGAGESDGEIIIAVRMGKRWMVNPVAPVANGSVLIEFVDDGTGNNPPFPP